MEAERYAVQVLREVLEGRQRLLATERAYMASHGRYQAGYAGFAVLAGVHQIECDDLETAIKELG